MDRYPGSFIAASVSGAVILALIGGSGGAQAQVQAMQSCAPQETLVNELGHKFGEAVTAQGVDGNGNLVQVFTSEVGTWTIAITLPGGPSCIVSAGEGWSDDQLASFPKSIPQPGQAS